MLVLLNLHGPTLTNLQRASCDCCTSSHSLHATPSPSACGSGKALPLARDTEPHLSPNQQEATEPAPGHHPTSVQGQCCVHDVREETECLHCGHWRVERPGDRVFTLWALASRETRRQAVYTVGIARRETRRQSVYTVGIGE